MVFPVCGVLQGWTYVSGPVDDCPLFSEEHFLLQYVFQYVPLCLLSTRPLLGAANPRHASDVITLTLIVELGEPSGEKKKNCF